MDEWMLKMRILPLLLFVVAIAGCGKTLPATVSGTITLDGEALPSGEYVSGIVMFYPSGGGAAAMGDVTSGGVYKVQTGTATGLTPGDYVVTVSVVEMEPPPPGGYQNAPGQKLLTPPRYNDRDKTDLKYTVAEGSNEIDIDLVSQ